MYDLTEANKKRLTEFLGECDHPKERVREYIMGVFCHKCKQMIIFRTFTTWSDLGALKEKLMEKGEFYGLDSFLDFADSKWSFLPESDPCYEGNFTDYIMDPTRFCWLVNGWLKEEEEEK